MAMVGPPFGTTDQTTTQIALVKHNEPLLRPNRGKTPIRENKMSQIVVTGLEWLARYRAKRMQIKIKAKHMRDLVPVPSARDPARLAALESHESTRGCLGTLPS